LCRTDVEIYQVQINAKLGTAGYALPPAVVVACKAHPQRGDAARSAFVPLRRRRSTIV
jgi:hypothetical protein